MCHNKDMKKIYDQNLINQIKKRYKIDEYFSKKYEFIMIEYEQGETIINPLEKTQYIQFVVEGTLLISFINLEGKQTIVSQSEEPPAVLFLKMRSMPFTAAPLLQTPVPGRR